MNPILMAATLLMLPGPALPPTPSSTPKVIRAVGIGQPPRHLTGTQARLMARRAAEVIAVRNLAAKLARVDRVSTHRHPTRVTSLQTRLRGFQYGPAVVLPNGHVKVVAYTTLPPAGSRHYIYQSAGRSPSSSSTRWVQISTSSGSTVSGFSTVWRSVRWVRSGR